MPPKRKKLNELTLEKRVELINFRANHTERETAEHFNVGKGTVGNTMKRKLEYLEKYENENVASGRCRKSKKTENDELNSLVWEWFKKLRSIDIPLSGPMVQQTALTIAEDLRKEMIRNGKQEQSENWKFSASNGWLESFRKAHQLSFKKLCGESASADTAAAEDFHKKIPEICKDYPPKDRFNVDETALLFRALPDKSLVEKHQASKGTKFIKDRLTLLLGTSQTGEKLKPLIIGKSKKPHCFRNINVGSLPVTWKFNSKAWMTSAIFEEWLIELNKKFKRQNREVIFFLDNCTAHPRLNFSNIRLQFLPPNTTSLIQPLDQGIIRTFKSHYRRTLLRHLISRIKLGKKPNPKDITVLDAIYWCKKAWDEVSNSCIKNCFRKCSFPADEEDIEEVNTEELEDTFDNFISLAKENGVISEEMSEDSYKEFDINIPVYETCMNIDSIIDEVLDERRKELSHENVEIEINDDEDEDTVEPVKCPTYSEVASMILQLKEFASTKEQDLMQLVRNLESGFTEVQVRRSNNKEQTTLDSFLQK